MAQEGTVGIGTQTPNRKAVLHLVAGNNNQGFLVPRMSSSQRISFGSRLNESDNGMMVYDADLNQFYFWSTSGWEAVGGTSNSVERIEWVDLTGIPQGFRDGTDDVIDADNDPTNEIQDLQLISNILSVTGKSDANQIDLAPYAGTNTDAQNLKFAENIISLSGDPDNTQIDLSSYDKNASDDFSGDWGDLLNIPSGFQDGVDDVEDADASSTNEIQDLKLSGDNLTITGKASPTTIKLAKYLDNTDLLATISGTDGQVLTFNDGNWGAGNVPSDGDSDVTNEIQDLSLSGNILTITGNASPTAIDLAPYLDNTDLLASIAGASGKVLTHDGSSWVAGDVPPDGDSDATNEMQDLSLSGNILTITGNTSPTAIDLSPYSGTNTDEQDLQFSGGVITLTGDPNNTSIDLAPYLDNTDLLASIAGSSGKVLTHDGSGWVAGDVPSDGDGDATNEIQDLSLSDNILTITGNASPTAIDLSPYSGTNTDEQDLQFSGSVITLTGDPDNTSIDLAPYLDNTDLLASIAGSLGNVITHDGSGWVAGDVPSDGDSDATNEIQDLDFTNEVITLSDDPGSTAIDLAPYKDSPFTKGSDVIGEYVSYPGHIKSLNVLNTVTSILHTELSGSVLTAGVHKNAKIVMIDATGTNATITQIDPGLNGQEIKVVCTGGTLEFNNSQFNGSNLVLPSFMVTLPTGGSIQLMYVSSMGNWIHMGSVTSAVNPN